MTENEPTFIAEDELSLIGYEEDGVVCVVAPTRDDGERWINESLSGKWVLHEETFVHCTNPPSDPDQYSDKYAEWMECERGAPGAHPAWRAYNVALKEVGPEDELRANPLYDATLGSA